MNFNNWAINKLEQGKKVRRPSWEKNSYWKLGDAQKICWRDGTTAHVHINQIKANDWEIYEEKYHKIPRIKLISKRDFKELKHKYDVAHSWDEKKIYEAKDSDVLALKVLFQNGKHCIHQVWILNEATPELFMELMFGKTFEDKK